MTDQYTDDHEVELHDSENEFVEEAHDPKNAEAQSVASVDQAGDASGTAPKRKGDNTKKDPMPKTKAGMINAAYTKLSGMKKEQLSGVLSKIMSEDFAEEEGSISEAQTEIQYEADFSEDLNALINDEATLSEEFKSKAETIFEAALKSKLSEEIDRLEAKYEEELSEEIETTKSDLVEKVDSYLNYVVEQWMADNQVAIQSGLRAEIAENFMEGMKNLFQESYIEVPESKVDLVDELADTVEELEEQLNDTTAKAIEMSEALEFFQRREIVREAAGDLAETQIEKLNSLVEDIDFEDAESFAEKVATVKESYFKKAPVDAPVMDDSEDDNFESEEIPSHMAHYVSALKKTNK